MCIGGGSNQKVGGPIPPFPIPPQGRSETGEAWKAESGGSWVGGKQALPISKGVWGSAVSSPSGVRGGAPAAQAVSCIL